MKKCCIVWLVLLTACLPGERASILPADAHAEFPMEEKYVAMTFDDGPRRSTTEYLLDGLLRRGASATFFLVGEQIAGNEDLVLRMVREGHQVGNHTWSHKSLMESEETEFFEEIRRVEDVLEALVGEGNFWLRPPYGQITAAQMEQLGVPLVKWSVDPRDWESRNAQLVEKAVLEQVQPGSIILLHDIYESSAEAALHLVDKLQMQGYEFITVEELLALYGIEVSPGVMYRAAVGQMISRGNEP